MVGPVHERSYKCKKLEQELKKIDLELADARIWARDKRVKWGVRASVKYILIPLLKFDHYMHYITYRGASLRDNREQRELEDY